jgi:2-keto-4-pentenoate hydratase
MTPVSHIERYRGCFSRGAWDNHAQAASMIASEIANQFVSARRSGRALSDFPGPIPGSLSAAYAVQDAAIQFVGRPVVGWKVGRIFPPLSDQFGADRLAGPIFSTTMHCDDKAAAGLIFTDGFGAAEAEFLIKIANDLPPGKMDYTLDEAAAQISAVHIGIEIASSPLPTINELGPAVTVSDFGNNNGLIIGPQIDGWQTSNFANWDVGLEIDGIEVGRGAASAFPDGPIGSVRFLLNNLGSRGIAVAAGTWISSGAVTGVHRVIAGQKVRAVFGKEFSVNCTIEAAPIS